MPLSPAVRSAFTALRTRAARRARARALLDKVQDQLREHREDAEDVLEAVVEAALAQLGDATEPDDVERVQAWVAFIVVRTLPGEAYGPLGVAAERLVAVLSAAAVERALTVLHERVEARLAAEPA